MSGDCSDGTVSLNRSIVVWTSRNLTVEAGDRVKVKVKVEGEGDSHQIWRILITQVIVTSL